MAPHPVVRAMSAALQAAQQSAECTAVEVDRLRSELADVSRRTIVNASVRTFAKSCGVPDCFRADPSHAQ